MAPSINSQSVLTVWRIQGSPLASFMVARALIMTKSEVEDEEILLVRAASRVQIWKRKEVVFRLPKEKVWVLWDGCLPWPPDS